MAMEKTTGKPVEQTENLDISPSPKNKFQHVGHLQKVPSGENLRLLEKLAKMRKQTSNGTPLDVNGNIRTSAGCGAPKAWARPSGN